MKKKINIIGAGISGLCAGCYLQMNGFETQIFEKHSMSGGLCTSWEKQGYTIDCSVHWILGSTEKNGFFDMWNEILDMEKIDFHNHEVRLALEVKENTNKYGNKSFLLYTNLDRLQKYMLDIAPEDKKVIQLFIKNIRKLQAFKVPPMMDKLPFWQSTIRGIKMIRYLKFLGIILYQNSITNKQFAQKFKNPFLKEAISNLFDDDDVSLLVFNFPMASFDNKSAGYPIGGSYSWAKRIEQKYISLGGKIHYNTPVQKIIVEDQKATAVLVRNNVIHHSDMTLSASDWHKTVFDLLDGKYVNEKILKLKNEQILKIYYSILLVTFGLKRDYKEQYHFNRFPINTKLNSPCGKSWDRLETHFYYYDPTLAQEGKTVMACSFYTSNGKYWIDLRKNDRKKYREEKQKFVDDLIQQLEQKYPGISNDIEMVDFATPASVLRYTNNWQGSAQGWLPGKNVIASSPISFKLPNLKNFYYASHWNRPGGGVPVALNMARDVAKLICKENQVDFKVIKK
ncbi:MAG TPA: NAD(P)/FAD-dependent oxidoreductase [Chitinophagaceae bacterium]|nr:NAD(P)/FAD-dependent oxidoreductase [Chitinophagaceae bacterium]